MDTINSLPYDISIKIASSLEVAEVCSLGRCSRYFKGICGSDSLWESLYRERWPSEYSFAPHNQVWRSLYVAKHNEMAAKADLLKGFLEEAMASESIEVGKYLGALELLHTHRFGFKDVQIFLLKPKQSVLLNLIGLHYCILWLHLSAGNMIEALQSCNISERQVCVHWWKLGRWLYGFRLRDELHSRSISLGDLAAPDTEVLGVLRRGAVHEVIRVQILAAVKITPSWSSLVNRV